MFRDEALAAGHPRWLGDVLLVQPLPIKVGAVGAALAACVVVAFLAFGTYTHRVAVVGRLMPASGVAKIYAPQSGVVTSRLVSEGQRVSRGDVLYVVSSERQQRAGEGVHASVTGQIAARAASLKADIEEMQRVHSITRHAQQTTVDTCKDEIVKLDALIRHQTHRVALAKENHERYTRLLAQDFVSRERAQEKHAQYLEQNARLSALQRERVVAVRALSEARRVFESMPLAQHRELTNSLRELAKVEQERVESEGKREFSVVSPVSGVATAIVAETGQNVSTSTPVASILPADVSLEAHLYVRSQAVGFLRRGDRVHLRYRAFAYQQYGHFVGVVTSVSEAALPHSELADVDAYEGRYGAQVPVYLVKVGIGDALSSRSRQLPLRAGMMLDADIMRETRRLYEWALHPLRSLGERI
ncbi:HlyD family secretion protein [Pandoraea oxalativorans]|uniref:AprE-like beta-barrel domain-containing protein n=1 Tax=Pandoraea oxalativorans TaxID=573737 RepID=A0A0E3U626_9BURK|nr:HlyD family efflux transporter periplasmic adaptor subunit [Pandoraea oxalativorans]AKC69113.1 hypothetical protein MB84_05995 [Pandoraea oxalativorans]